MQGPKVAVVLVSVFNTLNTIDCRVRARRGGERMGVIFLFFFILKDAGIRLDNKRFAVRPGQARGGSPSPSDAECGASQTVRLSCVSGAAILQLI